VSPQKRSRTPITRAGGIFTIAMFCLGAVAALSGNNLLFLIVAAMLSTLMLSSFVSRLSLSGLELDFALPEHIAARRKLAGRIAVRNIKRWMPSFSVHLSGASDNLLTRVYFPVIPGGAILEHTVEVRFERRGIYRESGFEFSTSFPFGFLLRRIAVTLRRDVVVYPAIDPQPGFEELLAAVRGDMDVQWRGRGHDFYRIRPYEALESARHVDWKATAHTGDLQVREFAREQDRELEIFLDLNVPEPHAAWFEQAVDACAYLVWSVTRGDARLRFRTQQFDASIPETADVYTVLRYLATVTPLFGRRVPEPGHEESYQIVFTAADPNLFAENGWMLGRIIGPGALPRPAASPDSAA
jgi:uncharacterized protein (DUF58 family)